MRLALRQKILAFTGGVLLTLVATGILDAWILHFSVAEFRQIMENNARDIELVRALKEEIATFQPYINQSDADRKEAFLQAERQTGQAVLALPFDYASMGKALYAKTWSIRNAYEVYVRARDEILQNRDAPGGNLADLQAVYDMQDYLLGYANALMIESMEMGNRIYAAHSFWTLAVPIVSFALVGALFCFSVRLAGMMNRSITEPVAQLAHDSRRIAANDFDTADVCVENEDEIGELVAAFNKMKHAMGQYIQTLEEKRTALDALHKKEVEGLEMQRRLESAKMELLVSQINPHFLFNTLNTIGGMANLEDAKTTEKMIKSLSDLLRYSLKNDQAVVPLSRELQIVEDYMYLQHMRFGARISYEISCQVDADAVFLPTFTFQPLVENAILHGLTPKVEGGKIRIWIGKERSMLSIVIADNGMGMKKATRERLQKAGKCPGEESEGIGFANVSRRIYAMYPGANVELSSEEQKGTTVKIQIPEQEAWHDPSAGGGR